MLVCAVLLCGIRPVLGMQAIPSPPPSSVGGLLSATELPEPSPVLISPSIGAAMGVSLAVGTFSSGDDFFSRGVPMDDRVDLLAFDKASNPFAYSGFP